MRDQYAGDVSDYLKFAFLRRVVTPAETLGVAWWWLAGHDGRSDGRHDEYLTDSRWKVLDPKLFDMLAGRPARDVAALEALDLWPARPVFHREAVPGKRARSEWSAGMLTTLAPASIIFADPDNGVSRPGGVSPKSATIDEALALASRERPVLLIRFPHRLNSHDEQLAQYHTAFAAQRPVTVRTCVRVPNANGSTSPRIRWFTALNPTPAITAGIEAFASAVRLLPGAAASVN
ncbi:hypothetical protein [Caulobacter sp. DWP3-1-3b2]|uniref:hypothetical protein n=1 Tax=Caulobacter sp. DWP3-1-3b2 TaxID=2804643 RepID=UPI003CEAF5C9